MIRPLFLSIALIGAAVSLPRPAAACGACSCFDEEVRVVPAFTKDLPLNPTVFVLLNGPDTSGVKWTRVSDGAEVPLTFTPAGGPAGATWVSPQSMLDPSTEYRLSVSPGVGADYTTGLATDTTPLTGLAASISTSSAGNACDPLRGAELHVDRFPGGESALLQLDITGPGSPQRLFLSASTGLPAKLVFGAAKAGYASCLGARSLTDAQLGVSYTARLIAFDAAGNAVSIDLPSFQLADIEPGGCPSESGCAVRPLAERQSALIPLLGLAAAMFALRRARRARPSNIH